MDINNTTGTPESTSKKVAGYIAAGIYVVLGAVIVGSIVAAARKENKEYDEDRLTKLDMDRSRTRINNAIASGIETGAIKDVHYRAVQVSDMFDVSGFDTSGNIPG